MAGFQLAGAGALPACDSMKCPECGKRMVKATDRSGKKQNDLWRCKSCHPGIIYIKERGKVAKSVTAPD